MILEAKDISFSYSGKGGELFSNINFKVENNERVWIPGPSGYGKTTLCKILAGYFKPCKGQDLLDGMPLPNKGYCPVQMIWQHPEKAVNPRLKMEKIFGISVIRNICSVTKRYFLYPVIRSRLI